MACSPPPTWARPPGASKFNCRSCSLTSHRGQAQRLQARGIQFHANFAIDAADALHLRNATHTQQAFGDGVVD